MTQGEGVLIQFSVSFNPRHGYAYITISHTVYSNYGVIIGSGNNEVFNHNPGAPLYFSGANLSIGSYNYSMSIPWGAQNFTFACYV